ncbi:hypothetical protein FIBSPDRAFT_907577 [Athelia psychrophila]|uniref:SPT2-domain-containing protein n=1 Tax=Athelia psychrophila TaxID=1759441 RepID=A0A166UKH4_9AGAM|nr:hypothetical protein FIBSPDRAFT_907577 [Fibularhizoctonia sp. CBS 109695]
MSGFAALMALSASQTKESQNSVQAALAQRQRKEEEKQKQQAAFDRKEREREATLRQKHLEDQKRQEESKVRREQEAAAKQRVREKREEDERHKLLYGPKKSKSDYPSSTSHTRDEVRKRRLPDDDDEMGGANALTREEKRRRKEDAELRRAMAYGKSASHKAGRSHRVGGKLAGGAIDIISAQGADGGSGTSSQSIKARISAAPNTLTRLNVVKRDTRTIDEILTDRAKLREANVLDGDNAREFNNWFGDKKKEPAPKSTAVSTPSPGSSTPVNSNPSTSKSNGTSSALNPKKYMIPNSTPATGSRPIPQKATNKPLKTAASGSKGGATSKATSSARPAPQSRKRTRSVSLSDDSDSYGSPPKRRPPPSSHPSVGEEIWKMFGKDRSQYVERDVFSDDEDMEADATAMEMEEYRSARMAKKEDEAALAEENRREQEKRRKKKEKEMRERRA